MAVLSLMVSQAQTSSRKVNVHFQFLWLHAETHTCRVRGCAKNDSPHISTIAYPLTSPMCLLYLARNLGAVTQADGSRALQDVVHCGSRSAADTGLRVQEIPADSGAGILACASAIGKADSVGRGDCNCLESVGKRKKESER